MNHGRHIETHSSLLFVFLSFTFPSYLCLYVSDVIRDQVAALHWIQENIGEFGGDPTNVTIFGQGQGAAFANVLMLAPMAKGTCAYTLIELTLINLEDG